MANRGTFITFEGTDGCGKTTQLRLLAEKLRATGLSVVETVEPGGTETGRLLRKILLDSRNTSLHPRAELFLYFASRAQNVAEIIEPALALGSFVLCDRFTDSTVAYQGYGRGLNTPDILRMDRIACAGVVPNLTLLIEIDLETSRQRSLARNEFAGSQETRIDDESAAFHARVRDGYRALANENPKRVVTIDGSGEIEVVARRVWEAVSTHV